MLVTPLMNYLSELPSKVIWAVIFAFIFLLFLLMPSPAQASEVVGEQIEFMDMALVLWNMRSELPWYVLLPLVTWLLSPVFSLIVSMTPTPKDDSAWVYLYKWLEMNAFNFWRAKDKPIKGTFK